MINWLMTSPPGGVKETKRSWIDFKSLGQKGDGLTL